MFKLLPIILLFWSNNLFSQTLSLKLKNIRNQNGVFRIGFFISEKSYKDGEPLYYKTFTKKGIQNGELTLFINNIEKNQYGIVVLDDENENDKTDFGILLPKEGFGFSNYEISFIKKPEYDDFKFNYGEKDLQIIIKMKYL